jgi:hypothetical protein
VGQNRDIEIANRSFGNMAQFKYLGATVTNQNLIQGEIKRRLNLCNVCYHSVQNLLFYCLLSKDVKIPIFNTIILFVVLYGSLTVRKEHSLRVFGSKVVLRRIFGLKRDEVMGEWEKKYNEELCNFHSSPSKIRMTN